MRSISRRQSSFAKGAPYRDNNLIRLNSASGIWWLTNRSKWVKINSSVDTHYRKCFFHVLLILIAALKLISRTNSFLDKRIKLPESSDNIITSSNEMNHSGLLHDLMSHLVLPSCRQDGRVQDSSWPKMLAAVLSSKITCDIAIILICCFHLLFSRVNHVVYVSWTSRRIQLMAQSFVEKQ